MPEPCAPFEKNLRGDNSLSDIKEPSKRDPIKDGDYDIQEVGLAKGQPHPLNAQSFDERSRPDTTTDPPTAASPRAIGSNDELSEPVLGRLGAQAAFAL